MKLRLLPILLLFAAPAFADTFGSGANTFTMDFVTIGNAGNADDDTGYGGVGYTYRMGVNEVSERMIDAYNALSGGPTITKDTRGLDRPATSVSWNEAARFVNWLNTSQGYSAAYKFTTGGANDNIALWTISDAGYDAANPFRNANAHYFLPSEDEWYKAAYYDPNKSGGAGYWNYATGSDSAPTAVSGGTTSGTAVYRQAFASGPANITNAGGLSPYDTMAQNGNVWEWVESGYTAPNDSAGELRVVRDGTWYYLGSSLTSSTRVGYGPAFADSDGGFRVAAVPEPSAFLLTLIGTLGVVLRRKRG
jgi:formylglycine-generating enzyme required for sulfatase activity